MLVRDLIEALGGSGVVARALGLRASAVGNWSLRGEIPGAHHVGVWRLAREAGLEWSPPGAEGFVLTPREAA